MGVKMFAVSVAAGAAIGAVAVMMMPHGNPVRKLACKAADSVENAADMVSDKLGDMMDKM